jgi:CRP-like cAMP-binding protein
LPAEAVIFKQGEMPDAMYIITAGKAIVERERITDNKEEEAIPILILEEGDFFGELTIFDEGPRSATLRVLEAIHLLRFERKKIKKFLNENPPIASKVLQAIVQIIAPRIRQTNQILATVYEIGRLLGSPGDFKAVLKQILTTLVTLVGAEKGLILLVNKLSGRLEPVAIEGFGIEELCDIPLENNAGITGWILEHKRSIAVNDLNRSSLFNTRPLQGFETRSMLIVPVRIKDTVLGMVILGRESDKNSFGVNNLNLVELIASQVAPFIELAKNSEEMHNKERLRRVYFR